MKSKKSSCFVITCLILIGIIAFYGKVPLNNNFSNNAYTLEDIIYMCPSDIDFDLDFTKNNVELKDIKFTVSNKINGNMNLDDNISNSVRIYRDIESPTLTLNGDDLVTVYIGDNYEEAGYDAYDNCDGSISYLVKISGRVDTSKEGIYNLHYEVRDSSNNKTEVVRKVVVKKRGVIYLTFDDGPRMGTTDVILDILKEEGVKATFFVTNSGPDSLILREYQEGHSVALHTASHRYSEVYSSIENYFADLALVHDRVYNITGYDSRFIRFPGGSSNTISKKYYPGIMTILTQEVVNRGFRYYDWNINSGDAGLTTDPVEEYNNVISKLSIDGDNVILMHDIKPHTRDALRNIIRYAKAKGYSFDKITEQTEMVRQKVNN